MSSSRDPRVLLARLEQLRPPDRDGFRTRSDYRVVRAKVELRRSPEAARDPALIREYLAALRPGYLDAEQRAEQRRAPQPSPSPRTAVVTAVDVHWDGDVAQPSTSRRTTTPPTRGWATPGCYACLIGRPYGHGTICSRYVQL